MGSGPSLQIRQPTSEPIPPWTNAVSVRPEYMNDKFDAHSDGMTLITPTTVSRSRTGKFDTDAARWSRGFTSGKHVFEIVYPSAHRGSEAAVGVGLKTAPLHSKGRVVLVGNNRMSWGICLRSRRAFHNKKIVKKYPQNQAMIPDRIFMYLDVDSGTLAFASDSEYLGTAISGIQTGGEAIYPMVASCHHGSAISMVYRGEAVGVQVHGVTMITTTTDQPQQVGDAPPPYQATAPPPTTVVVANPGPAPVYENPSQSLGGGLMSFAKEYVLT